MLDEREFCDLFDMWQHAGMTPLVVIEGYVKLFLAGDLGVLSDEQRQVMELIHRSCVTAMRRWHYPREYLQFRRWGKEQEPECKSLSMIIGAASHYLRKISRTESAVQVVLPEDLPSVKAWRGLVTALEILLAPEEKESTASVEAKLHESGTVLVRIEAVVSPPSTKKLMASLSTPGTRMNLAAVIVRQHGSELKVQPSGQGIEFEFTLPLWNHDAGN